MKTVRQAEADFRLMILAFLLFAAGCLLVGCAPRVIRVPLPAECPAGYWRVDVDQSRRASICADTTRGRP